MFRSLLLLSLALLTISAAPAPLTPFVKPTNISQCLYSPSLGKDAPTCFDNPNSTVKEITLVLNTIQLPGFPKALITINGSYPGPTLEVNQFDIVVLHVINEMTEETTVHVHGMRQYKSPHMDGVPALTQCPIAPNSTFTYRFCADRSGTFWYHAHHNEHIVDGLFGALIIRPQPYGEVYAPQYDIEIPMLMSDFYNTKGNVLLPPFLSPASLGAEPVPEQFVINGRFAGQTAWAIERNKKLRLRMINSGAFAMFTVSIDAIPMTVIEIDGTDVEPLVVTSFAISVAQRVSVLLDLSQVDPAISAINIHAVADPAMFDPDLITNGAVFDVTAAIFLCDAQHTTGLCANPVTTPLVPMHKPISFDSNFKGYPNGQYNAPLYEVNAPVYTPAIPANDLNLLNTKPLYPAYVGSNSASCYRIFYSDITKVDAIVPMVLTFGNDPYEINRGQFNGITYDPKQQWGNLYMQPMAAPQPLLYNTIQSSQAYSTMLSNQSLEALSMSVTAPAENQVITVGVNGDSTAVTGGLSGIYADSFLANASNTMQIIGPNQLGQYILPPNKTIEIVVINTDPGFHPIHFHGYAPWIISSSQYPEGEQDNYGNYPIRDVWNIPGDGGWVKLRITTDNPGVWIFHCHISWHLEAGLAAVFIDNIEALQTDPFYSNGTLIPEDHMDTCTNYNPPIPAALVNPCQVFTDNDFNFVLTPATQARWAITADLIIMSESIFGLILYKLNILHYMLMELIGMNVGTLVGAVFIELIKESYEQIFMDKNLVYVNVVVIMCFGFLFPLTIEKFIKRGRSNKFKFLSQDDKKEGELSTSTAPTGGDNKGGLLNTSRLEHASSQAELVTPRQIASSNADMTNMIQSNTKYQDEEKQHSDKPSVEMTDMQHQKRGSAVVIFHGPDATVKQEHITVNVNQDTFKDPSSDVLSSKTDVVADTSSKQDTMDITTDKHDTTDKQDTTTTEGETKKRRGSGMERIAALLSSKNSQTDYTLIAIILIGEMIDNFVDGGVIASAFLAGNSVGIATTIGVFMEELPHLTGSFAIFVGAGAPIWKCVCINVFSASAFLAGTGCIMGIASNPNLNPAHIYYLLPFASGSFLYVALVDLTPVITNAPWKGYLRATTAIGSVCFGIGIQAAVNVYSWKSGTS